MDTHAALAYTSQPFCQNQFALVVRSSSKVYELCHVPSLIQLLYSA
jgi:hypothetical protein